jgi:FkbM family methyltransferase
MVEEKINIVQIGANTGDDDVFSFIIEHKNNISKIVLVEPIPFIIENLKNKYSDISNVIIEKCAITNTTEETLPFFYEDNSDNYQVSSFNHQHVIKSVRSNNKIVSMNVPVMTINKLFEKHKMQHIHHLFIDTEGKDADIIESIDFDKYDIDNITFESAHTDGNWNKSERYNNLVTFLKDKHYDVQDIDQLNSKAIKRL